MNSYFWAPKRADYDSFFAAVSAGDIEAVRISLSKDININALLGDHGDGETALHIAAATGQVNIVKLLIAHGALVDSFSRSNFGPRTPLHDAAFSGRLHVVELLLDESADIHAVCEQEGETIHQVLRNKELDDVGVEHVKTIELLLERGSDIHSVCLELGGTVVSINIPRGNVCN